MTYIFNKGYRSLSISSITYLNTLNYHKANLKLFYPKGQPVGTNKEKNFNL